MRSAILSTRRSAPYTWSPQQGALECYSACCQSPLRPRKRPREETTSLESPRAHTYRPSLRLVELVSLGVGGTIGSGIFIVPGLAAGIAGPASIGVWAVVAAAACAIAAALAALQARSPTGVPFVQLFEPVFGARISACLIALYVLAAIFGIATIAAGLGQYLAFFGVSNLRTVELAILAGFLIVNLIGIVLSGQTENVLTVAKLAALIVAE